MNGVESVNKYHGELDNKENKVRFFKYKKRLYGLLETTNAKSRAMLEKFGGGYGVKMEENSYVILVVDGEMPPSKKNRVIHRLIKRNIAQT